MEKLFIHELLSGNTMYHINGGVTPGTRKPVDAGLIVDWIENKQPVLYIDDYEREKEAPLNVLEELLKELAIYTRMNREHEYSQAMRGGGFTQSEEDYWRWYGFLGEPGTEYHPLAKCFIKTDDLEALRAGRPSHPIQQALFDNEHTYPPELDIAFNAWRAVAQDFDPKQGTAKQQIETWLMQNHSELSDAAFKRITKVANFDSEPGRRSYTE